MAVRPFYSYLSTTPHWFSLEFRHWYRTRPMIRIYWLATDASTLITGSTLFSISSLTNPSSNAVNSPRWSSTDRIRLLYRILGLMERMQHHLIRVSLICFSSRSVFGKCRSGAGYDPRYPLIIHWIYVYPTFLHWNGRLLNTPFFRVLLDYECRCWWNEWMVPWSARRQTLAWCFAKYVFSFDQVYLD